MLRLPRRKPFVAFLVLLLGLQATAFASPLAPDVRASRSPNGRFLVVVQREYDNPNPRVIRRVLRTTYEVLEMERFLNSRDRLNAAVSFWSGSASWQVTLQRTDGYSWPMISDDGVSLVLIQVAPAAAVGPVLQIYRRHDNDGVLVRSIHLDELWNAQEMGSVNPMMFDSTPEWFSGGSLAFSPDGQELTYRTQWNDILHIRLTDGSVSRQRP